MKSRQDLLVMSKQPGMTDRWEIGHCPWYGIPSDWRLKQISRVRPQVLHTRITIFAEMVFRLKTRQLHAISRIWNNSERHFLLAYSAFRNARLLYIGCFGPLVVWMRQFWELSQMWKHSAAMWLASDACAMQYGRGRRHHCLHHTTPSRNQSSCVPCSLHTSAWINHYRFEIAFRSWLSIENMVLLRQNRLQ